MNIKMHIEYIGTDFCGWQKQANSKTVQDEIEKKLELIYSTKITLLGSGRTDSGVHGLKQVANFHTTNKKSLNPIALKNKLNSLLSSNIRISYCAIVNEEFHAQHSCRKKTYMYKIKMVEECSVFEKNRFLYIKKDLNLKKMRQLAALFLGKHDFINFCKTGYSGKDTTRRIYSFTISKRKNIMELKITGSGFLRGMVRLIIGALINYEKSLISKADVSKALRGEKKLKKNLAVPACGLYLYDVKY
jgi:tRNA pseudouridine38-40 synthase